MLHNWFSVFFTDVRVVFSTSEREEMLQNSIIIVPLNWTKVDASACLEALRLLARSRSPIEFPWGEKKTQRSGMWKLKIIARERLHKVSRGTESQQRRTCERTSKKELERQSHYYISGNVVSQFWKMKYWNLPRESFHLPMPPLLSCAVLLLHSQKEWKRSAAQLVAVENVTNRLSRRSTRPVYCVWEKRFVRDVISRTNSPINTPSVSGELRCSRCSFPTWERKSCRPLHTLTDRSSTIIFACESHTVIFAKSEKKMVKARQIMREKHSRVDRSDVRNYVGPRIIKLEWDEWKIEISPAKKKDDLWHIRWGRVRLLGRAKLSIE